MKHILLTAMAAATLFGCAAPADMTTSQPSIQEPVSVFAAGSLREAMTDIARDYETRTGQKIALTFGASGLLRERIEKGDAALVFASADIQHPQRLANAGAWGAPSVFVRNSLCALTQAKLKTAPATLLDALLDPTVRLGTSTPKADPSGDYAWELFRKADLVKAGAYATLDAKALKLTGGADSPKAPAGLSTYAWVMDNNQADIFLTYCTNAVAAQKEVPRLVVVALPANLQVGAAYGVTVKNGAPPAAAAFAKALLATPAQTTFARYGFGTP